MARLKRVAAVLLLAALVAAVPGVAHAEKTIALSSGSFEFTVEPGGIGSGEVTVMNDGEEPLKALVYVADMRIAETGSLSYVTPQREGANLLTTPATWFRIYMPADSKSVGNTPYIELDPGERLPIKFEFSPPAGTAPGDHNAVIFFEMFELTSGADGSTAQVTGRLGTRVALRVAGQTVESLTIRPFDVPSFQIGGSVPYTFTVNNEGNINKHVAVSVAMLDSAEDQVASSMVTTDTIVFANAGQQFTGDLDLSSQRLGPHTVEVTVSYMKEGDQIASTLVEQRTVWLLPLWAVVAIGFLVTYAIIYVISRVVRGRRRTREATRAKAHSRSHRQRDAEAEERRLRREQRAAEAAGLLDEMSMSTSEPAEHRRDE